MVNALILFIISVLHIIMWEAVLGIVCIAAAVYIFKKHNMINKIHALYKLTNLTTQQVDEYLDTFDMSCHKNADEIHKFILSPKDYANKVPVKGASVCSENTAIANRILDMMQNVGNIEKMYVPPLLDKSVELKENQIMLEKQIADYLDVTNTSKILDIGCGTGMVAEHIHSITNAEVHGFDIELSVIETARDIAYNKNKDGNNLYKVWDYNEYPWPYKDNTFDGVYQIQSLTFIQNPARFFKELKRITKPGARIVFNESALTDDFDADNNMHVKWITEQCPNRSGGVYMYYKYWEDLFRTAGFKYQLTKFPGSSLTLIKNQDNWFDHIESMVKVFVGWCLVPKHVFTLLTQFRKGARSLIKLEEQAGYRHNVLFIATAPLDKSLSREAKNKHKSKPTETTI